MTSESGPLRVDIAVIGAGAVGLVAALALAARKLTVALVAPPAPTAGGRSVALLHGSVELLKALDVWDDCAAMAQPMRKLAIVDVTDSLFRPPPVTFDCAEIGLAAFGWNIELDALTRRLEQRIARTPTIDRIGDAATDIAAGRDGVSIRTAGGRTIDARFIVGADGAKSAVRDALGIAARRWSYPQSALTTVVAHRLDHGATSTELHTREGPFTLVPMPGRRSAVVWVAGPGRAARLHALADDALAEAVAERAGFMLGDIVVDGPRGLVPMQGLSAERLGAECGFLVGEAAHAFPPIGAQGLNLGLRDVAALASILGASGRIDPERAVAAYERARKADVALRILAVDLLDRTLLSDVLPADFARGAGLLALATIGPLRRFVMRRGLGG